MTTVKLKPPVVDVLDILEYAKALLEEHGWRQGERVPNTEEWDLVAENGLSLHDAIGMACYRLSGEAGSSARGTKGSSNKDFSSGGHSFRVEATEAVKKHIPGGKNDIAYNDEAKSVGQIFVVLDAAIKEESNK